MAKWRRGLAWSAAALALIVSGAQATSINYGYDALGRVTSVTYPSGTKYAYTYDSSGNRTQQASGSPGPIAVNDAITTTENTAILSNVVANDYSPGGLTLSILTSGGLTTPSHGTVTRSSSTQVNYTPTTGYVGTDSFQYTIADTNSIQATATVTVTVSP